MIRRGFRLVSWIAAVAITTACSQGATQLSPSAPSGAAMTASSAGWLSAGVGSGELTFSMAAARRGAKPTGAGTVASLRGSCVDGEGGLSMVVHGVHIVTDDDTEFFIAAETPIAGGCGNLRPGTKVVIEIETDVNEDGSYTADTITIIDQPSGRPPSTVAGDGIVASLKGTCDILTMVIHGYPVMTISSTVFSGAGGSSHEACLAIVPGTRVHVEGTLAGNSVVASTVEILPPQ